MYVTKKDFLVPCGAHSWLKQIPSNIFYYLWSFDSIPHSESVNSAITWYLKIRCLSALNSSRSKLAFSSTERFVNKVYFDYSESQAQKICRENVLPADMDNAGAIFNHRGTMEYTQGQLSVAFKNMQLKKIRRADRKGQELVMEEKFCILFRAKIQAGEEFEIWVCTCDIYGIVE